MIPWLVVKKMESYQIGPGAFWLKLGDSFICLGANISMASYLSDFSLYVWLTFFSKFFNFSSRFFSMSFLASLSTFLSIFLSRRSLPTEPVSSVLAELCLLFLSFLCLPLWLWECDDRCLSEWSLDLCWDCFSSFDEDDWCVEFECECLLSENFVLREWRCLLQINSKLQWKIF